MKTTNKLSSGQILIEVIIASLVIIVVSIAIAQIFGASLTSTRTSASATAVSFLANEEGEGLRAIAREDWHNISILATSSANQYFVSVSGGKWINVTGTENISLNNLTYNRYFYVGDVYRSTSTGDIVSSGGYYDPSTDKASIYVNWNDALGNSQTFNQIVYISRFFNQTYSQSDWSGGSIGESVYSVPTSSFATSSGIDYSSASNTIKLNIQ